MKLVFGTLALASTIACGPPYQLIQHAEPNPFVRPGCRVVVEPIHTEQLRVGEKSEAEYVSGKGDDSAASYMNDKQVSDAALHQRIADDHPMLFLPGARDNTFIVRPMWLHWEPGYYAVVASAPGKANFMVEVLAPSGQTLDRMLIETRYGDFSSGGRMKGALRKVGAAVSAYIADSWACQ